ncbi:unnamed protein product [Owenia fusiformis]|uniref:Uncharacterized protein n=1 Tax=Owenia fusiformis TaxID=6347 RepID=A0A8J1UN85_OWEFU|nr:unnamed protein product [Owenia fusiformis]
MEGEHMFHVLPLLLLMLMRVCRGTITGEVLTSEIDGWVKRNGNCPGMDIDSISGISVEKCAEQCKAHPSCVLFTYYTATNRCFRKSHVCTISEMTPEVNHMTYHPDPEACETAMTKDNPTIEFSPSSIKTSDLYYGPQHAYIDATTVLQTTLGTVEKFGGWMPATNDATEYWEVSFRELTTVDKVITQGGEGSTYWVTQYNVKHKPTSSDEWVNVGPYDANTNAEDKVTHLLVPTAIAKIYRLEIIAWNGAIAMRVELIGCLPSGSCSQSLIKADPDVILTVSSVHAGNSIVYGAGQSKIDTLTTDGQEIYRYGGLSAGPDNQDQWLQAEFPKINVVTEVIIQGANRRSARITTYKVLSSMDGVNWIERGRFSDQDPEKITGDDRCGPPYNNKECDVLTAYCCSTLNWCGSDSHCSSSLIDYRQTGVSVNGDVNTKFFHKFSERFLAKYVRIVPLTWNVEIEFRAGYLGCDYSNHINLNESFDNTFPPMMLSQIIDYDLNNNTCMNIPNTAEAPGYLKFSTDLNLDFGSDTEFYVVMTGRLKCESQYHYVYSVDMDAQVSTNLHTGRFEKCQLITTDALPDNRNSCTYICGCNPCGYSGLAFFNLPKSYTWTLCDVKVLPLDMI